MGLGVGKMRQTQCLDAGLANTKFNFKGGQGGLGRGSGGGIFVGTSDRFGRGRIRLTYHVNPIDSCLFVALAWHLAVRDNGRQSLHMTARSPGFFLRGLRDALGVS